MRPIVAAEVRSADFVIDINAQVRLLTSAATPWHSKCESLISGASPTLTKPTTGCMVDKAMKVQIPAIAFMRGFKVDHEPIFRFKDDWRPTWILRAEFERALARPWTPRRPIDLVLDTSELVRK